MMAEGDREKIFHELGRGSHHCPRTLFDSKVVVAFCHTLEREAKKNGLRLCMIIIQEISIAL